MAGAKIEHDGSHGNLAKILVEFLDGTCLSKQNTFTFSIHCCGAAVQYNRGTVHQIKMSIFTLLNNQPPRGNKILHLPLEIIVIHRSLPLVKIIAILQIYHRHRQTYASATNRCMPILLYQRKAIGPLFSSSV